MRRPNHKVIVTTNKHISVNPSVVLSERERAQKQTHNKPWGETVKTPQGKLTHYHSMAHICSLSKSITKTKRKPSFLSSLISACNH